MGIKGLRKVGQITNKIHKMGSNNKILAHPRI